MTRDWVRLGRAFEAARRAVGLTQIEAAAALHITRTTVQAIERGRQPNGKAFTKVTSNMRAYARLVGWSEDSPDLIADGGDPVPAAAAEPPARETGSSDLPPAVELELRSGRTLDSAVIHLGTEDDDARIVVVAKGAENMSEEDLDRIWQQFRRARRHLQGIASETETPSDP
ncbi:helix-turn-helix domain-containing protein [Streptomyces sp. NPDC102406]|uniref:helix-turn-helix domain-containing protein n=1 Tax=Streptomyces sp. NPDC102406 TaxID=3366171 RepID=UPI00381DF245